jgi:hypothetical protein
MVYGVWCMVYGVWSVCLCVCVLRQGDHGQSEVLRNLDFGFTIQSFGVAL